MMVQWEEEEEEKEKFGTGLLLLEMNKMKAMLLLMLMLVLVVMVPLNGAVNDISPHPNLFQPSDSLVLLLLLLVLMDDSTNPLSLSLSLRSFECMSQRGRDGLPRTSCFGRRLASTTTRPSSSPRSPSPSPSNPPRYPLPLFSSLLTQPPTSLVPMLAGGQVKRGVVCPCPCLQGRHL